MEKVRKINNELAIAGQIGPEQIQQLVQQGFRSVLNLRLANEQGFWASEQQQVEALGLHYRHQPTHPQLLSEDLAILIQLLQQLPKPTLIHCSTALRSAALVLIYVATHQGASLQQARQQAEHLGLLTSAPVGPLPIVHERPN